jgi:YegS/Rv2252/BmrU family lipid kinase
MPKYCFIFNPTSGRNHRRPEFVGRIRDWIEAERLDSEFVATEAPHHATVLAREAVAKGCERIVAIGGDGTLNEVACGVVHSPAAIGIIPCGSGNGLGLHLGIRGDYRQALRILTDGHVRHIDTGIASGHRFFNAMGVGFDAEIARRFNSLPTRGLRTYVETGWKAYFNYRPQTYTVAANAATTTRSAFIVAVTNSDQYGNNARVSPGARVDDGRLDLVAIPAMGFVRSVLFVARLFAGDIRRHQGVFTAQDQKFIIRRAAAGVIHVDGETREASADIEVRIEPRSLRILSPKKEQLN